VGSLAGTVVVSINVTETVAVVNGVAGKVVVGSTGMENSIVLTNQNTVY